MSLRSFMLTLLQRIPTRMSIRCDTCSKEGAPSRGMHFFCRNNITRSYGLSYVFYYWKNFWCSRYKYSYRYFWARSTSYNEVFRYIRQAELLAFEHPVVRHCKTNGVRVGRSLIVLDMFWILLWLSDQRKTASEWVVLLLRVFVFHFLPLSSLLLLLLFWMTIFFCDFPEIPGRQRHISMF